MTTTADVVAATGLTYRKLDYWIRCGYVRPGHATPGSGYQRWWPDAEVAVAERMAALVREGLTVEAAARRARPMNWTEYAVLLADGSPAGASSPEAAREQADALNDMTTDIGAVHQPVQRTVHITPVDKTHTAVEYGPWSRIPRSTVDGHFGHDSEED